MRRPLFCHTPVSTFVPCFPKVKRHVGVPGSFFGHFKELWESTRKIYLWRADKSQCVIISQLWCQILHRGWLYGSPAVLTMTSGMSCNFGALSDWNLISFSSFWFLLIWYKWGLKESNFILYLFPMGTMLETSSSQVWEENPDSPIAFLVTLT